MNKTEYITVFHLVVPACYLAGTITAFYFLSGGNHIQDVAYLFRKSHNYLYNKSHAFFFGKKDLLVDQSILANDQVYKELFEPLFQIKEKNPELFENLIKQSLSIKEHLISHPDDLQKMSLVLKEMYSLKEETDTLCNTLILESKESTEIDVTRESANTPIQTDISESTQTGSGDAVNQNIGIEEMQTLLNDLGRIDPILFDNIVNVVDLYIKNS